MRSLSEEIQPEISSSTKSQLCAGRSTSGTSWTRFDPVTINGTFFALSFVAIAVGMSLGGDDPVAQLRAFVLFGLGGMGVSSAVRHIAFAGALRGQRDELGFANATFFEWEAGFANLAFGVAGIVAALAYWGPAAYAVVAITYSIYLAGAAVTHWLAGMREGTLRRSVRFGAFTLAIIAAAAWRVVGGVSASGG